MRIRTIPFFFREALISLARNRILSLATVITVAVCIFILGMACLLFVNTGQIMNKLESDVEIVAFLDSELSPYQIEDLRDRIAKIPQVRSVTFVSRDEALENLNKRLGEQDYNLAETLGGENPLPDSFKIKARDPHAVERIAKTVSRMEGVDGIRYGRLLVQRLLRITTWIRGISMFIVVCLALSATFLVAITIRLTIYSRRKEIYIMKLVGATDWFIRMPFFIEGLILALTGTAVAVGILAAGYHYLVQNVKEAMAFIPLISGGDIILNIYLSLFVIGIALGLIGTFISVNKYLDV